MEVAQALTLAAKRSGWSPAKIAATVGKSEQSARSWMKAKADMSAADCMTLRRELPGFAELLDGVAA